jgi:hypothetical protein
MATLTTRIMFLLFTCMRFWVWGILRRWLECSPTAYEVVRDCRKFEKLWVRECVVYCIHVAKNRDRWRDLVEAIMNLQVL